METDEKGINTLKMLCLLFVWKARTTTNPAMVWNSHPAITTCPSTHSILRMAKVYADELASRGNAHERSKRATLFAYNANEEHKQRLSMMLPSMREIMRSRLISSMRDALYRTNNRSLLSFLTPLGKNCSDQTLAG